MAQKTPLFEIHQQNQARFMEFAGYEMPLHYGSQIEEHRAVREGAGIFDVSHMMVTTIHGQGALDYLSYLLANNVAKLQQNGKALYSCLLNEQGGVIDDLIVYRHRSDQFEIVSNAGTRDKDTAWFKKHQSNFQVDLACAEQVGILAIQGPKARDIVMSTQLPEVAEQLQVLNRFHCLKVGQWVFARTGYTGEDGFEVILPQAELVQFWHACVEAGAIPCGLAARDSLRIEAGLNLYGHEMDEAISPLQSNLAWTVAFKPEGREFIGRKALEKELKKGVQQRLVGLVLSARGMMRPGQKVLTPHGDGVITSGSFSPDRGCAIAMARIPYETAGEEEVSVIIRNQAIPAKIVALPFLEKK